MSNLFDQFSGLSEFVDLRHESYVSLNNLLEGLRNFNGTPSEALEMVTTSNWQEGLQEYQRQQQRVRNGNQQTIRAMQQITFRDCKPVMRGIIYV